MMNIPVITVDPAERYELSPWLYMQFMEPLGVTDSSVEAAWDHRTGRWYDSVIKRTRELSPPLIRWGGILSSYYRWREGVGDPSTRRLMLNLAWGGIETNQIGTAEFCRFCEAVGADKLYCVNFLSDGIDRWQRTPAGESRTGDAREAADWVDYCNNPGNPERIAHGRKKPYNIKLWQIGNETSYHGPQESGFQVEEAARHTLEFAKAMRATDPNIKLIGWGDSGWAPVMADIAGEELDYIAFHYHVSGGPDSVLRDNDYRRDWDQTWEQLMTVWQSLQGTLDQKRQELTGTDLKLAMTEGHFALPGRNRCELLSSWAAGVADARALNIQERNGDILKIATLADFCGTRWMVNALYIEHPSARTHLMPVGHVMALYRHHVGRYGINATAPFDLDVAASRTGDKIYLHVVNPSMNQSRLVRFSVAGGTVTAGRAFVLSQDPRWEIMITNNNELRVREYPVTDGEFSFPAASVTAVELDFEPLSPDGTKGGTHDPSQ